MDSQKKYGSYSFQTKLQVVNQKNPYLFLNQGVPRTTAIYWIKNSKKIKSLLEKENRFTDLKNTELKNQLLKEITLKELLIQVRKIHPYSFNKNKVKSKVKKKKLIEEIRKAEKITNLKTCLSTIDLSRSTYYRWITSFQKCKLSGNQCQKRKKHQLTVRELNIMKSFVVTKKYSHIPISSLHLLAQRQKKLYCSLHTWYKYINLYDWRRPKLKYKKPKYRTGLRATFPNQYWHIDVSQIPFSLGKKMYFQAIIDNYSRYIISWRLTDSISGNNTVKLLQEATTKKNNKILNAKTKLICDAGSENTANTVAKFIHSRSMIKAIAQRDIIFSNSMVEYFFKSLKHNYFNYQKIRTKEDIERKIKYYVQQHNNVIPRIQLNGATPKESYNEEWSHDDIERINKSKLLARQFRKKEPLLPSCKICS